MSMWSFLTLKRLALLCFFVLLALIAVWTLGPIGVRPRSGPAAVERVAAYAILAGALTVATPSRPWRVLAVIAMLALMLEAGQGLIPGRHARARDAAQKIAGAAAGVLAMGILAGRVFPPAVVRSSRD